MAVPHGAFCELSDERTENPVTNRLGRGDGSSYV